VNFQMPDMPEIPDPPSWSDRNDIDNKLMVLVSVVETSERPTNIGITLTVPGGVITGLLASHTAWVDHMKLLAEASGGALTQVIEALGSNFAGPGELELDEEEFDRIHLIEARFVLGGSLMPSPPGFAWRGRLKDVSGWSIGSLS
jgi:hypothetical protein